MECLGNVDSGRTKRPDIADKSVAATAADVFFSISASTFIAAV